MKVEEDALLSAKGNTSIIEPFTGTDTAVPPSVISVYISVLVVPAPTPLKLILVM
jgi:hypothetical protein